MRAPAWLCHSLFLSHEAGGIVVWDGDSGSVREHLLPGEVVQDLVWDAHRSQLLAALALDGQEGARVVSLELAASGLKVSQQSPGFDGELRLLPAKDSLLVVNRFESSSWQLLDAALQPSAPGRSLVTPAGLRSVPAALGGGWLALDTSGYDQGEYQDSLVRVRHDGTRFEASPLSFPAAGRPESRFLRDGRIEGAWIIRKHDDAASVELGRFAVGSDEAPRFDDVALTAAAGPLVDALQIEPAQTFVLLLGGRGSTLLGISRRMTADQRHVLALEIAPSAIPGACFPEALPVKRLAWQRSLARLWVATEGGVTVLARTRAGFEAERELPQLRAPLATPNDPRCPTP